MKRDLHHIIQSGDGDTSTGAVNHIAPVALTTANTPTAVDLAGYRSCEVIINTGVRTDGTWTFTVQESDDNSAFSAVANADLRGGNNAIVVNSTATASTLYARGYIGNKRYLRVAVTETSASSGIVAGASIVRGHRMNKGQLN